MSLEYAISPTKRQELQEKSEQVSKLIEQYLEPLLEPLDAYRYFVDEGFCFVLNQSSNEKLAQIVQDIRPESGAISLVHKIPVERGQTEHLPKKHTSLDCLCPAIHLCARRAICFILDASHLARHGRPSEAAGEVQMRPKRLGLSTTERDMVGLLVRKARICASPLHSP